MPPRAVSTLLRRARLSASFGLIRGASRLTRSAMRFADLASGFAMQAVERDDRGSLTASLYSAGQGSGRATLFPWEEPWFTRDLPPPPARVLLGGAGRGREARWLLDRGYTVIAFDPAPASVALHNKACPEAQCMVLDYESLARASQARGNGNGALIADTAARVLAAAPYDAALLGWGSLTHVLEDRSQDALFGTLDALVPHGPILASFFMGRLPPLGRASGLGSRLGRMLGPAEHATIGNSARVRCMIHLGFAYYFDRERLEQLAQCAGRRLELHEDSAYPHATFR
jgi:hypothetical protein